VGAARPHLEQTWGQNYSTIHWCQVGWECGRLRHVVGMIWSLQQREFVSIMPSGDHEVTQCATLVHLYPFLPAVKITV
jgi:hypothetical protein